MVVLVNKFDMRKTKRIQLEKMLLTHEEKARWGPMLHETWQAIAADMEGQRLTRAMLVETVCDANRPMMFGGMTQEEYDFLMVQYTRRAGKVWINKELGGYV
jgi:hypothetical protein